MSQKLSEKEIDSKNAASEVGALQSTFGLKFLRQNPTLYDIGTALLENRNFGSIEM
ncbi:hypothetical protein [Bacillus mycoides]|uniref:hypothetical protein n=1 Tax=Bacillus mycoides TaxID=1405 RepID=UPI0013665A50|nr:hypothetical protein [Bacillus mycoides]